jgi:hypothetical protein
MSDRIKVSTCPSRARLPGTEALAYAAGLFDGEGCVHIARQRKPQARRGYIYRLTVPVAQNHLDTLTDFQQLSGVEGRVYLRRRQGSTNRDAYALCYDGEAAANLLERLSPFLRRKADEAREALRFQRETHLSRHFGPKGCPEEIWKKRDFLYSKLRSLK